MFFTFYGIITGKLSADFLAFVRHSKWEIYNLDCTTSHPGRGNEPSMKCVLTLGKWLSQDSSLGIMAMSPNFPCLQSLLGLYVCLHDRL